jgi:hypothetical protein
MMLVILLCLTLQHFVHCYRIAQVATTAATTQQQMDSEQINAHTAAMLAA